MARRQVGMLDSDLLDRVDAAARDLGQTRRVFVERALEATLTDVGGAPQKSASSAPRKRTAAPRGVSAEPRVRTKRIPERPIIQKRGKS